MYANLNRIHSSRNRGNGGFVSMEAAVGIMLLLILMSFAVKNAVQLFHHVQLEEAASRLIRVASREEIVPPYPFERTDDFVNRDGEKVGTTTLSWDADAVSLEVTLDTGLKARREWPREDL